MTPLVSCITPTLERADRHADLYACFASQTYPEKELLVFDGSRAPSPFFSALRDPRVRYTHEDRPKGEVTRIGAERNALLATAQGAFAQNLDDDDWYAPQWLEAMMARIGGAALAKLGVWNALQESSGSLWQWDVTKMGGTHYAVVGSETPIRTTVPGGGDPRIAEVFRVGYGFSYLYPRSTWERFPYPDEGTEDVPWTRAIVTAGLPVVQVMDCAGLVLHTVHPQSESVIYPQRRIAGLPRGMVELARGKALALTPGRTYSLLAAVKDKHTLKGLAVRASSWGMDIAAAEDRVPPASYGVGPVPGGYRLVYVTGSVKAPSSIPWSVPAPLSVFDKTTIVKAWGSLQAPPRAVGRLPPRVVLVKRRVSP
jgi:Glycosyl transferase family 2